MCSSSFCSGVFSMRAFGVVENNVLVHALTRVRFWTVLCTIQFLTLHRRKERFHYRVVIWNVRTWKRVSNVQRLKIVVHRFGTVVATAVSMKDSVWIGLTCFIGNLKSRFNKLRAVGLADFAAHNHTGKMKSRHSILKGESKPCLRRLYSRMRK